MQAPAYTSSLSQLPDLPWTTCRHLMQCGQGSRCQQSICFKRPNAFKCIMISVLVRGQEGPWSLPSSALHLMSSPLCRVGGKTAPHHSACAAVLRAVSTCTAVMQGQRAEQAPGVITSPCALPPTKQQRKNPALEKEHAGAEQEGDG